MSDILQLLARYQTDSSLSWLCIRTTNPVYLMFRKESEFPDYVFHTGKNESLTHAFDTLQLIWAAAPNLVPEPLEVIQGKSERGLSVERGLAGRPWYQIAAQVSSQEQWQTLVDGAIRTLGYLRLAIQNHYPNVTFNPTTKLTDWIESAYQYFETLPTMLVPPQHGDFCVNNLLIQNLEDEHYGVVDFEDFGKFSIPLQDEFSLALSLHQMRPSSAQQELVDVIKHCTTSAAKSLDLDGEAISHLLLIYLLERIGPWSDPALRGPFRDSMIALLSNLAGNPSSIAERFLTAD